MSDYRNFKGNVTEWPQAEGIQDLVTVSNLRLKEINLFKRAEDDNFGSNIGAQFITTESKSLMIRAKSVQEDDVIKCTESNSMEFLYE